MYTQRHQDPVETGGWNVLFAERDACFFLKSAFSEVDNLFFAIVVWFAFLQENTESGLADEFL